MLLALALLIAAPDPTMLDVSLENATAWTDGKNHYVVRAGNDVFYGTTRELFKLRPHWSGEPSYFDERYPGSTIAVGNADGSGFVTCGERTTTLHAVDKPEAVFAKAAFKRPKLDVRPYLLARDDHGVYYYVDQGVYPDNAAVFHVYAGERGNMRALPLKNIVHDAVGDIFATKNGELRLIASPPKRTEWAAGKDHATLTEVPIDPSTQLIFNELGAYKGLRMGTPCDDL